MSGLGMVVRGLYQMWLTMALEVVQERVRDRL
jgi:hypothetical protein